MISVVVPILNEKNSIGLFLDGLVKVLDELGREWEVVVVNGESQDGSSLVVKDFVKKSSKNIRLIQASGRNSGLGRSILLGIKKSNGEVIVGMDGDGNHCPEDLPVILSTLSKGDLVVGSRFVGKNKMRKCFKYFHSFLFNILIKLLGMPIWDNTSGYYGIYRVDLEVLDLESIFRGYGDYHLRLVWCVMEKGLNIVEVGVDYGSRIGGNSKSNWLRMFKNYLKEVVRLKRGNLK